MVGVDLQLSGCGSILVDSHFQATLSKLLTYCVLRPTQPPTLHEMGNEVGNVAYGLRGESLVWLIGAVVCLLAANRRSSCSLRWTMDGRILRRGIISSCQLVATSKILKRFWS